MNHEIPNARRMTAKSDERILREVPIGSESGKSGIEAGCRSKKSGVGLAVAEKVAGAENKPSPLVATG